MRQSLKEMENHRFKGAIHQPVSPMAWLEMQTTTVIQNTFLRSEKRFEKFVWSMGSKNMLFTDDSFKNNSFYSAIKTVKD